MESAGVIPAGNVGIEKIVITIFIVMFKYAFNRTFNTVCKSILVAVLNVSFLE